MIKKREFTNQTGNFAPLIGMAEVEVVAINPNASVLAKLTGRDQDQEPVYLRTATINEKEVQVVDIVVWVKIRDKIAKERLIRLRFPIYKDYWVSQSGRVQIINAFGNTAWVTREEYKAKNFSAYSWFENEGVRLPYRGESSFINMLKNWYNLPNPEKAENKEDAFCYLDNIDALFKGDFKELHMLVENAIGMYFKVLLGAREGNDGKLYQDALLDRFLPGWSKNADYLIKGISDSSKTIFTGDLKELHFMEVSTDTPDDVKEEPQNDDDDLPF